MENTRDTHEKDRLVVKPQATMPDSREKDRYARGFIPGFGLVCLVLAFLGIGVGIFLALRYATYLGTITDKGPMWLLVLPQYFALIGASFAGYIWSRSWMQKQEVNRHQASSLLHKESELRQQEASLQHQRNVLSIQVEEAEKNRRAQEEVTFRSLQSTNEQFKARLEADQNQFQRRILEERFNRILDDFASQDAATRAGAASRFVSIAQALEPGLEGGVSLKDKNHPYYMPSVRQLVQRLAMEDDKRVAKAIQDALREFSVWTTKRAEGSSDEDDRYSVDEMQATVIHLIADTNRAAYSDWLEALACVFRNLISLEEVIPLENEDMTLGSAILHVIKKDPPTKEGLRYPRLPDRFDWSGRFDLDFLILKVHLEKDTFEKAFRAGENLNLASDLRKYHQASTHLLFARDILVDCLKHLPAPTTARISQAQLLATWERNPEINLRSTFLQGAIIENANLQGVSFDGSILSGASLDDSDCQNSQFFETDLRGASLDRADLANSRFDFAEVEQASFFQANLQGCDFRHLELSGTNLSYARVHGCNLHWAFTLDESALKAEFREATGLNGQSPQRPLNKKEQEHYDEVKQKLISQGNIPPDHIDPYDWSELDDADSQNKTDTT